MMVSMTAMNTMKSKRKLNDDDEAAALTQK